ncbi:MAG: enoyl-CoA hydratase-related protein, partial [Pseudomonadota bacterium]
TIAYGNIRSPQTLSNLRTQPDVEVLFLDPLSRTGARVKGEEAYEIGLADELTTFDNLRAKATELGQEIAESAPLAVMSIRATLREGLADAVAKATDHELAEQNRLRATDDFKEGVKAVGERRSANFQGR